MSTLFVLCLVSSALSAVVIHRENTCSATEYRCADGSCVSMDHICDGSKDCADGSDEAICTGTSNLNNILFGEPTINRYKRQTSNCQRNQWSCRDGTCISFDGKCDGTVDCPDGSDETHALCRGMRCQSNWFRCTYGACVDGTARCNGIQECADNSDELHPKCRNDTNEVQGQFRCDNGQLISSGNLCDGTKDCADGSDETVRVCAATKCNSYLFQCAYGACVDQGSDCNNKVECADGSDESDELCNRMSSGTKPTSTTPSSNNQCVLPPYQDQGSYVVANVPNASPGQVFDSVLLNFICKEGYALEGAESVYCVSGLWLGSIPQCTRACKLIEHPSVKYRCLLSGDTVQGDRECQQYEKSGTIVKPTCNEPNYYYSGILSYMRCINGFWDYQAICNPECGKVTPAGEQLIINGEIAKRGELPWHTGIYKKSTKPYKQICGGSLISSTVVISAAHCFWDDVEKLLPASLYAVAVGKLYRPYDNPEDKDAQKSDVRELKIPERFQGVKTNFQEDIALVLLAKTIRYETYVRPICVDFDINEERNQLKPGNMGKVAGWGLAAENGEASQVLKVVDLPYVDIPTCLNNVEENFWEYVNSDKICAGYTDGTAAVCKGDSGGGLAFPQSVSQGSVRYYLRGIVSTSPQNENKCNSRTYTTFTLISRHETFIKRYFVLS